MVMWNWEFSLVRNTSEILNFSGGQINSMMGFQLALLFFLQTHMIYTQTLDKMDFKFGDFLKYSVVGKEKGLYWPYHYMVALSNTELMDIRRDEVSLIWCYPRIISKLNVPEGLKNHIFEKKEVDPTRPLIGRAKTLALAKRMSGLRLPYDMYNCNCKHYSYYVMYGRTYAKWFCLDHRTRGESCPLARQICKDVDVFQPGFTLKDAEGDSYPLNDLSQEDIAWLRNTLGPKDSVSANIPPFNTSGRGQVPPPKTNQTPPSNTNQPPRSYSGVPRQNPPPRTMDRTYSSSSSFNIPGGQSQGGGGPGQPRPVAPANSGSYYPDPQSSRVNSGYSYGEASSRAKYDPYFTNDAYRKWVDSKQGGQGRKYY